MEQLFVLLFQNGDNQYSRVTIGEFACFCLNFYRKQRGSFPKKLSLRPWVCFLGTPWSPLQDCYYYQSASASKAPVNYICLRFSILRSQRWFCLLMSLFSFLSFPSSFMFQSTSCRLICLRGLIGRAWDCFLYGLLSETLTPNAVHGPCGNGAPFLWISESHYWQCYIFLLSASSQVLLHWQISRLERATFWQ